MIAVAGRVGRARGRVSRLHLGITRARRRAHGLHAVRTGVRVRSAGSRPGRRTRTARWPNSPARWLTLVGNVVGGRGRASRAIGRRRRRRTEELDGERGSPAKAAPRRSGRRGQAVGTRRRRAPQAALDEWAPTRRGVEVFVEPQDRGHRDHRCCWSPTTASSPAARSPHPAAAQVFARDHKLPIYDATIVGYPQRMRDYSRRQTILQERAAPRGPRRPLTPSGLACSAPPRVDHDARVGRFGVSSTGRRPRVMIHEPGDDGRTG